MGCEMRMPAESTSLRDANSALAIAASISNTIALESESARLSGPSVARSYSGYTGTGYADYANPSGDYIEWTYTSVSAAASELDFRYALGSGSRPLSIKVNGTTVAASLAFNSTGSWTTWAYTAKISANLVAGVNTIRATAIGSNGANLDHLRISPAPVIPYFTLTTSALHGTISPAGGSFLAGTPVDIFATPDNGYRFVEWSGDTFGTDPHSRIVMDTNKSVIAKFAPVSSVQVTFEAERLARVSAPVGTKVSYESAASGGAYVQLNPGAAPGDWIAFTLPSIAQGNYAVTIYFKSNVNRAIVQASIDGIVQGGEFDEYANPAVFQQSYQAGMVSFANTEGHTMMFTVAGKRSASSGYAMTIDKIVLTPR